MCLNQNAKANLQKTHIVYCCYVWRIYSQTTQKSKLFQITSVGVGKRLNACAGMEKAVLIFFTSYEISLFQCGEMLSDSE